jgi:glyoxylase-like metal-dependent hydrolase (beta-lactamase superfamily II)
MIIKKLVVGPLENNCYIIADDNSKEAFIVDPGDEPDRILDLIHENSFKVKYIICTHPHFDHVAAIPEIKEAINPQIVIHQDDLHLYIDIKTQAALWGYYDMDPLPKPDVFVSEGDIIEVGVLKFKILHTPGHSPGGISIYGESVVITGDTLFAGSVGRTDLHGGDIKKLKESFQRLLSLPDETEVLPGHGPETTIGKEKVDNFFNY